jgi:heptosyltransferase II
MRPRVVVLAPNWLGDAVMALAAMGDLRRAFPESTLAVAARPSVAPLFRFVGGVDEVVEWHGSGGLAAVSRWREDAARLTAARADIAVLLPNSFASAWVARRAQVPERWGYRAELRRGLLTRAVARPRGSRHQSEYYRHLVAALGMNSGGPPLPILVSEETRARARQTLVGEGCGPEALLVGLAPGAAYGHAKRWPPEMYAALIDHINERLGATAVLMGSAGDRSTGAEIERWLVHGRLDRTDREAGRVRWVNLIGRTDLPLVMAVTASCRTFVSNDSGAMHLTAALGVPVIAIFGPTIEQETAPLPRDAHTVLTEPVWCRPCMLRECPIDHRCMTRITVGRVVDAVRGKLTSVNL